MPLHRAIWSQLWSQLPSLGPCVLWIVRAYLDGRGMRCFNLWWKRQPNHVAADSACIMDGISLTPDIPYGTGGSENLDMIIPTFPQRQPGPVVLYAHGGGFVAVSSMVLNASITPLARAGCSVFSIDYPLAPEHPWPAPILSTLRAIVWIKKYTGAKSIALVGDSAGGNLVAFAAALLSDRATLAALAAHTAEDLLSWDFPSVSCMCSIYGFLDCESWCLLRFAHYTVACALTIRSSPPPHLTLPPHIDCHLLRALPVHISRLPPPIGISPLLLAHRLAQTPLSPALDWCWRSYFGDVYGSSHQTQTLQQQQRSSHQTQALQQQQRRQPDSSPPPQNRSTHRRRQSPPRIPPAAPCAPHQYVPRHLLECEPAALATFPRTLLLVGTADPLLGSSRRAAAFLRAAGVEAKPPLTPRPFSPLAPCYALRLLILHPISPELRMLHPIQVQYREYRGAPHGFLGVPPQWTCGYWATTSAPAMETLVSFLLPGGVRAVGPPQHAEP